MAQDRSTPSDRSHKAATRPLVEPTAWHVSVFPSASRRSSAVAASADAAEHGWPGEQEPSRSLAATPERRTRICLPSSPNSEQRNVSPSVMEATVQANAPACFSRSEEHTSELQSLMRISYAVFCL